MFKWAKWLNGKDTEKEIVSPNGRNKCTVALKSKQIFYKVDRDNKPIVGLSRLGFDICGENIDTVTAHVSGGALCKRLK